MLTFVPLEEIAKYETYEGSQLNPVKELLAYELTALVHGDEEAKKAQDAARSLFSAQKDTENMPSTDLTADDFVDGAISVIDLLVKCGLTPSKGEARRLIQQGGVEVNDAKVTDISVKLTADDFAEGRAIIKKGKKTYHRANFNG